MFTLIIRSIDGHVSSRSPAPRVSVRMIRRRGVVPVNTRSTNANSASVSGRLEEPTTALP